jgi:hypothetical protein
MGACAHWNLKDPTISKTFKCAFQIYINIPQCTLRGISMSFFRNSSPSSFFRAVRGAKKGRTESCQVQIICQHYIIILVSLLCIATIQPIRRSSDSTQRYASLTLSIVTYRMIRIVNRTMLKSLGNMLKH